MMLDDNIVSAIKCGPVPKLRDWRSLPVSQLSRAEQTMAFAEQFLVSPEGMKAGRLKLAPFQEAFIYAVLDNPAGTRNAIMSVARRNGKSFLIAVILMSALVGPLAEQNVVCASAALSRDQAAILHRMMSLMIAASPALQKVTRVIPSTKTIVGLAKNTTYFSMSADAKTGLGRSIKYLVLDEAGQIRGPENDYTAMLRSSQGSYTDPLFMTISTQAPSDADYLSLMIDDAERTGDPKTVCHVYAAPKDCALLDPEAMKAANPGLGVFRAEEDLVEQLKQADRLPSMQAGAMNLLLNQRISLENSFMAPGPWKACAGAIDESVFRRFPVAMGLDLSMRTDLTAAVLAAQDEEGVVHVKPFVFSPISGMDERERRDKAPYQQWVRDGLMIGVPGATVDYNYVAQFLRDQLDDEGISISKIAYDRWRIDIFRAACNECGAFPFSQFIPVGQGYRDFSPRLEAVEALILAGKVRHGSHPLLNLGIANAIAVSDPSGARKLDKSKSTQRIDTAVAMVMAIFEISDGKGEVLGNDLSWMIA